MRNCRFIYIIYIYILNARRFIYITRARVNFCKVITLERFGSNVRSVCNIFWPQA
jgi:hypothetical protein